SIGRAIARAIARAAIARVAGDRSIARRVRASVFAPRLRRRKRVTAAIRRRRAHGDERPEGDRATALPLVVPHQGGPTSPRAAARSREAPKPRSEWGLLPS